MDSRSFRYYPSDSLRLRPDVPGASYFSVSLDHSMLTYFVLEPHCEFEEHQHPNEQITLVLSGKLLFRIDGEEVLVGPLEAIAVPAGVRHSVASLEEPVTAVDAWSPPREDFRPPESP